MSASDMIDRLIAGIADWRGETLAAVRAAILAADAGIVEEWKWRGSPVWSKGGIIVVGNAHKDKVKLTFANGAKLADPDKLFNNGLDGNKWRSIDFLQGDEVKARALQALVREAVAFNQAHAAKKTTASKK